MNGPRRLIDGGRSSLAQQLLEAGRAEQPPAALSRRVFTLAAGLVPGTVAGAAGATGGGLFVAKWFGIGVVAGGLVVGGAEAVAPVALAKLDPPAASSSRVAQSVGAPRHGRLAAVRSRPSPSIAREPASPDGPDLRVVVSQPNPEPELPHSHRDFDPSGHTSPPPRLAVFPPMQAAVAESHGAASVSPRSAMAEEIGMIDAARGALARRDAREARVALSRYRQRFPQGRFVPETVVLEIELQLLAGNRATAVAQARTFLAQHPTSPLVARVRALVDR